MKKLNELVGLANNATPGPWKVATDWERAAVYSTSKDAYPENKRVVCSGNQNNHKRFNAEPWSGSDWNDAAFIAAANPSAILAIAEAFRALEQRAEAAEARASNLNDGWLNAISERDEARSKLTELEKQEHYVEVMKDGPMTICHWMKPAEELPDGAKLFTRPAPAADLAELVPDEMPDVAYEIMSNKFGAGACMISDDMWEACRSAMLRNIEEVNK